MADKTSKLDSLPPRRAAYAPVGTTASSRSAAGKGIAISGAPAEAVGRHHPRMTVRMTEDEWDMLDRARGALSRNDMFRLLVRSIDRLT